MLIVCYVALLLPVLGFVNIIFMQYSLVADHWQYAATIVPCPAACWPRSADAASPLSRFGRGAGGEGGSRKGMLAILIPSAGRYIVPLALLAILATLTFRQSRMYADKETLYRTTLDRNPNCWLVQNNLGNLLSDEGTGLDGARAERRREGPLSRSDRPLSTMRCDPSPTMPRRTSILATPWLSRGGSTRRSASFSGRSRPNTTSSKPIAHSAARWRSRSSSKRRFFTITPPCKSIPTIWSL